MTNRFALLSEQVVTPNGIVPAAVVVQDGKIESVVAAQDLPTSLECVDYRDMVIGPGLVDAHIHINEPGRTEWEGFETATKAAAAGGITTLLDMPLNSSPVTIDVDSLKAKRQAADGKCWVDVGFYGGLVPGNPQSLPQLFDEGIFGVKAFLCDSGLEEFPAATPIELNLAMPLLREAGLPLLVHAELVDESAPKMTNPTSFQQFVQSRPSRWEAQAIRMMIDLVRAHQCHVQVVHLATSDSDLLTEIANAKADGLPITVETCPHYLHFAMEDIVDGKPIYKCAPPIRSRSNQMGLKRALVDGLIDTIGSDHSPCPAEMKYLDTGNIQMAWGGFSGVQFSLPVVWSAMQGLGVNYEQLFGWLSKKPAELFGLSKRKGTIEPGKDADFVIWNPNETWKVESSEILHRNGISPYVGEVLHGKVHKTYLRGEVIFESGSPSPDAKGRLLRR